MFYEWSIFCKWPEINVTLLTLKIAINKIKTNRIFPIMLMKLLKLYMNEIDGNINIMHL